MHRRSSPCLVLALLLGCAPGTVAITDRADYTQKVQGQLFLWTRAINNRSLDTLAMLYVHTRDLEAVWPDGERTKGWTDAAAKWKRWSEPLSQLNFVVPDPQVDIIDHQVAIATFRSSTDVVVRGERLQEFDRVTQVWIKDPADDRWRIRAEHRSRIPADG